MKLFFPESIELTKEKVASELHFNDHDTIERLLGEAERRLDPKAAYEVSYVDERNESGATIGGTLFHSKVLSRNLDGVGRVFPFVITIGEGLEKKADKMEDMLERYLLDEIGNMALRDARRQFDQYLRKTFALEKISFMSPGSLEDWPIEEQKNLFSLLSGVESAIGVQLSDTLLMLPRKSVSGIYFPAEVSFFSCQICPRQRCTGRKAKYDMAKAREFGVLEEMK
ncbi:MAG: vitamin B12 dependent methionine synthase [Desulfobacteraceae bacterium]|nr:MAG: vitamin B12 dependent methionine synthase [Desulfobacteraceae bacterium]